MPAEQLIEELKARGYKVRDQLVNVGGTFFAVVDGYPIEVGRFAGQKIGLAFLMPGDYPITPPGGIHTSPKLLPVGVNNIHPSPLGEEWEYWSRPVVNWRQGRNAARLMSHVNRLMQDA